jgi:predicted Zn-dependent protease
MSGYSREFEDQADRVGLRYVYEAGFDVSRGQPCGRSSKTSTARRTLSTFFVGDHSRPTERIKNIQRQLKLNYPNGPQRKAS